MRYEAIRRHRDQYPIRLMCRCLRVSASGFHDWSARRPSSRAQDNARLLVKIREQHAASDGVMGVSRMHESLGYAGETASLNRIARLMAGEGLAGVPQRRRWRHKPSGVRPAFVRNHLARDFAANEPNTKWVVDITYIRTGEGWLYLCALLDLYSGKVVDWSMSPVQDRHLVLKAVMMASWQRTDRTPVILYSDRGTQFTSAEYQQFLKDQHIVSSMSDVLHRHRYLSLAEARADVFSIPLRPLTAFSVPLRLKPVLHRCSSVAVATLMCKVQCSFESVSNLLATAWKRQIVAADSSWEHVKWCVYNLIATGAKYDHIER